MKNIIFIAVIVLPFFLNQAFCPPSVSDCVFVESGLYVKAKILENLSTSDAERVQKGNSVTMRVDDDVIVEGQIVVKNGSPAKGRIVKALDPKTAKNGGEKFARLEVVLEWVKAVDGTEIAISGTPHVSKSNQNKLHAEISTIVSLEGTVKSTVCIKPTRR